MTYTDPTARRRLPLFTVLVVISAAIAALVVALSLTPQPATSRTTGDGGRVGDAATVFDDELLAVAHLDADLRDALRLATTDAGDDGVDIQINSGWRSPDYQDQLLHDAISKYGSKAEAARWVAASDTSPHVSGDAVDIGPTDAMSWMAQHGAAYGLCQVYGNEPWHYELRSGAADHGCPPMYADPTQDPRMHG